MKLSDLQPAGNHAQNFGVKAVLYGGPGVGKTPIIDTAPRPILLAIEPGLLSMRQSKTPTWAAYKHPKGVCAGITEFFDWWFSSNETKNFDTLAIDSVSEMAEAILRDEITKNSNKLRAYGEMSFRVLDVLTKLYYQQQKHSIMIAKQFEDTETKRKRPSFPGQDLNVKVPHLFDEILHFAKLPPATIPGVMEEVKAIRCQESFDIMARDRSGRLSQFEQPNLANLFSKCMS